MGIVIDITPINEFLALPTEIMVERLLYLFGWMPIAVVFLWGAKEVWLSYIRRHYAAQNYKFMLLAIDIPRGNMQSPKAVENIFTYLLGAHGTSNFLETYWDGKFLPWFSFEIVSIEGYTQFLVYTPIQFRNLIESSIYSQYPDAEITEVNDYTESVPHRYPDDEYDIYGMEFIQTKNSAYPIKTYEEFEHKFGEPEEQFKDPMAVLMDLCSSLQEGEQLWHQIVITPLGFDWMDIGDKEISKILGEKKDSDTWVDKLVMFPLTLMASLSDIIFSSEAEVKKEEKDVFKMFNLKPRERLQLEAIQKKVSKLSFNVKMRFIYVSRKEVMNKPKVVNGFVGYMKQFSNLDFNNIKPDFKMTGTKTDYFFKKRRLIDRKNRLMTNYRNRDDFAGRKPGIMNVEELATLWHFPNESVVKAPLIQKAPGRKGEPPMSLPVSLNTVSDNTGLGPDIELDEVFSHENGGEPPLSSRGETYDTFTPKTADDEDIFTDEDVSAAGGRTQEIKSSPPTNLPFGE